MKRQSFCADECDPVGLYFDTTSGGLRTSCNEDARWRCFARDLPEIYAVRPTLPRHTVPRHIDEQDRVRRHMRCLAALLNDGDEVCIVGALSGG